MGSVRGIRREYRRLEWVERQRRRRQTKFVRRGREAIKRSIAAGDWIPRKRRVIGMLSRKLIVPANFDGPLPEEVLQDFEGRLTTDTKLTVTMRAKDDPGFVEALLNEASSWPPMGTRTRETGTARFGRQAQALSSAIYRSGEM